jgi:hypothetical protein
LTFSPFVIFMNLFEDDHCYQKTASTDRNPSLDDNTSPGMGNYVECGWQEKLPENRNNSVASSLCPF